MMETTPVTAEPFLQAIVVQYGARLTAAQLADIQRYLERLEHTARTLRAYRLRNTDEPLWALTSYPADGN